MARTKSFEERNVEGFEVKELRMVCVPLPGVGWGSGRGGGRNLEGDGEIYRDWSLRLQTAG